jgi:hypothetical protein
MNEKDRLEMKAHGIRCVPKDVYYYKSFKYERLNDAVRFAEIDATRNGQTSRG